MRSKQIYFIFVLLGVMTIFMIYKISRPQVLGSLSLTYNCQPGKTAFELLTSVSTKPVEYKESSYGKMVTAINGVPEANGKYWMYEVDNKEATISADSYKCQGREKIGWALR